MRPPIDKPLQDRYLISCNKSVYIRYLINKVLAYFTICLVREVYVINILLIIFTICLVREVYMINILLIIYTSF